MSEAEREYARLVLGTAIAKEAQRLMEEAKLPMEWAVCVATSRVLGFVDRQEDAPLRNLDRLAMEPL